MAMDSNHDGGKTMPSSGLLADFESQFCEATTTTILFLSYPSRPKSWIVPAATKFRLVIEAMVVRAAY